MQNMKNFSVTNFIYVEKPHFGILLTHSGSKTLKQDFFLSDPLDQL